MRFTAHKMNTANEDNMSVTEKSHVATRRFPDESGCRDEMKKEGLPCFFLYPLPKAIQTAFFPLLSDGQVWQSSAVSESRSGK